MKLTWNVKRKMCNYIWYYQAYTFIILSDGSKHRVELGIFRRMEELREACMNYSFKRGMKCGFNYRKIGGWYCKKDRERRIMYERKSPS